jgi:chromosome partitioning protein
VTERRLPGARAPGVDPFGVRAASPERRRKTGGSTAPSTNSDVRTARIMAVANQKGGVGKSTTAVSLGAALAENGHRVLVVDLDPQGNASTGLGIRHEAREVTVYDVLSAEADLADAVVQTAVPNLFAVPSTIDLAGAEIELVSQFSRELRLRRALEPLRDGPYTLVLLDCPPSLGLLTVNALAAAEELLVPIQCEYYALEGLGQLLRNVRLVQQNVNPGLRLSGIVMTMFDPRTKLSEQVVAEVRRFFGDLVYRTVIPRTVRLSEAPGFGQPITVYDPRSRGAECYRDLANEVATRPIPEGPLPSFEEVPSVVVEPSVAEPAVRSAPHPLRESLQEEEDDVDRPPRVEPTAETLDAPTAAVPDPGLEVETEMAEADDPGDSTAPGESDQEVDTAAVAVESAGPRADAGTHASTEAVEGGSSDSSDADIEREVVVIDAYDLDPDAVDGAGGSTEVESSPNGAERRDQDEDGRRKRWSLFRRGGRR